MARVNVKEIKERVTRMNDGWAEGAPTVAFSGVEQTEFADDIAAAAAIDKRLADLYAQEEMIRAEQETAYSNLNAKSVRVANGVRGDQNYGPDSPLYGAMGFVRNSERASGLTRKPRTSAGK